MNKIVAIVVIVSFAVLLCQTAFAAELQQGRFSERNAKVLNNLIATYGNRSQGYDPTRKPYIVCDWDNTSAFGDTEETLTYYMWENLSYKLNPQEFEHAVSFGVPKGVSKLNDDKGKAVSFDDLLADINEDYRRIYADYVGYAGKKTLADIRRSEEHQDLIVKLFVMFDALDVTIDTAAADRWQGQMMSNMTSEQLQELSGQSIQKNLGAEIREVKLTVPKGIARRCCNVSAVTFQGLRIYPDMSNLYQTLMAEGIDVYILSASPEDIIVPFANKACYGYGIPREQIFGVSFDKKHGVLQPELSGQRSMTWGAGKAEHIWKELVAKKGYMPLLVCGDSNGDYEMLSEFPDSKLGLIVNRLKGGKIGMLCQLAKKQMNESRPHYILQGINENTGLFDAGESSASYGQKLLQLLSTGT